MVPHWPDVLGKLSRGLRKQLMDEVAGEVLKTSHLFPDNQRLQQALQLHMQRHVFLHRQAPTVGPSELWLTLSPLQMTPYTDAAMRAGACILCLRCDMLPRLFLSSRPAAAAIAPVLSPSFDAVSLSRRVQGSVDIRLPGCPQRLLSLGKGSHFGEMAIVSQEQAMRYSVVASQVTVCLSLNFSDVDRVMLDVNFQPVHIKKRAMLHDALLVRCLHISKKIFESRAAGDRGFQGVSPPLQGGSFVESADELLLRRLKSRLFPSPKDRKLGVARVSSRHDSGDVATVLKKTSDAPPPAAPQLPLTRLSAQLKQTLETLKSSEAARIADVEGARKEVLVIAARSC